MRDKPRPLAEINVLKRLKWLALCLAGDVFLGVCIETRCKSQVLEAVKRKGS